MYNEVVNNLINTPVDVAITDTRNSIEESSNLTEIFKDEYYIKLSDYIREYNELSDEEIKMLYNTLIQKNIYINLGSKDGEKLLNDIIIKYKNTLNDKYWNNSINSTLKIKSQADLTFAILKY